MNSEPANAHPSAARPKLSSLLWAGWAASVPVVALATLASLAAPHVRGIGFFPVLRYAVVTPAVVLTSVASAFLYRLFSQRAARPVATLAVTLAGLGLLALGGMAVAGPPGLVAAALPTLAVVPASLAVLIPRLVEVRGSPLRTLATVVFGALEIVGVLGALASERPAPRSQEGLAFEVPRKLFDVGHKFVELPSGARIHYVDEGQGETLLFLHGNPAWSFQWRELISGLRNSYRCIALDYPGFGLSDAPPGYGFTPGEQSLAVEEFVQHLGLRGVTLVMQDWGGPIGLGFAGRRPELVRRVILGSTWAWPTDPGVPRGKFSLIAGGPLGEFAQVNFNGFASFGIKNGVVRTLPSEVADLYLHPYRPLDRRGIAAFYPGQITAATDYFKEVEAGLSRLSGKKALIFWALQDLGFPRADLERFQKAFPNHRTLEFANANHFFFEDTADQMIPEMRAFLSSDSGEADAAEGSPRAGQQKEAGR